jgi:hypothetical protein
MIIAVTVVSILAVTVLVWLANKILPFKVCPVCAGVFLTWVGLLGAHFFGYRIDLVIPALLMGGSVVGIAYQLEKKFAGLSPDVLLIRKTLIISAGFIVAYSILAQWWTVFLFAAGFILLVSFLFPPKASSPSADGGESEPHGKSVENLEKSMENCC